MAPQPKRKHSKLRKGKRLATRKQTLPKLVTCSNCKRMKIPHTVCKYCGK